MIETLAQYVAQGGSDVEKAALETNKDNPAFWYVSLYYETRLFHLLDYMTPTEFFQIGYGRKKMLGAYSITFLHKFLTPGNVLKWQFICYF